MKNGKVKIESTEVTYREWQNYGKHRVYFQSERRMINGYIDLDTMEATNNAKSWYLFDETVEAIKKEF